MPMPAVGVVGWRLSTIITTTSSAVSVMSLIHNRRPESLHSLVSQSASHLHAGSSKCAPAAAQNRRIPSPEANKQCAQRIENCAIVAVAARIICSVACAASR